MLISKERLRRCTKFAEFHKRLADLLGVLKTRLDVVCSYSGGNIEGGPSKEGGWEPCPCLPKPCPVATVLSDLSSLLDFLGIYLLHRGLARQKRGNLLLTAPAEQAEMATMLQRMRTALRQAEARAARRRAARAICWRRAGARWPSTSASIFAVEEPRFSGMKCKSVFSQV
jgi:hypothetical protein